MEYFGLDRKFNPHYFPMKVEQSSSGFLFVAVLCLLTRKEEVMTKLSNDNLVLCQGTFVW